MDDLFRYIAHWEHSKTFLMFLFMGTFLGIIYYLVGNPSRSKRLETYKDIPFIDDEQMVPKSGAHHENVKDVKK